MHRSHRSQSPPLSTPPPALSSANTNSNYSSLRQPLKNEGCCLEKSNQLAVLFKKKKKAKRSERFFKFIWLMLPKREKPSMTRCHWEDQCVNFVSLWDPLLWHLAQLWRLENVFNILMMFPGTCGKHPETFVHNDGETKDLAPSFLAKCVLLGGYVLHFHKTFLFKKNPKR